MHHTVVYYIVQHDIISSYHVATAIVMVQLVQFTQCYKLINECSTVLYLITITLIVYSLESLQCYTSVQSLSSNVVTTFSRVSCLQYPPIVVLVVPEFNFIWREFIFSIADAIPISMCALVSLINAQGSCIHTISIPVSTVTLTTSS